MAKKVREQNKWTIPSDWVEDTDGYMCYMLCVPNSRQWRGVFDGRISDLSYGRNWNKLTGNIKDNQEVARGIFESMCAARCDDILNAIMCICEANTIMAEASETEAGDIEAGADDGEVQVGPGQQFPDQASYFDAKCNVANGIFDTIREMMTWLDGNAVDVIAGSFGGVTSGLISGLETASPLGWAINKAVSAVVALAAGVIGLVVDYGDIVDAMDDVKTEAILGLFNASTGVAAENNFITALSAGTPVLTAAELSFTRAMLTNDMLNQLFSPRSDIVNYEASSPVVCGATLALWTFAASGQGWTFRDDSTGSYSASGAWNSGEEAWRINIVGPGTPVGPFARGTIFLTGLSIAVGVGNSVEFDHSAASDSVITARRIKVIFSDATEQTFDAPATFTAGTAVMSIAASKTISEIEVSFARNWAFPFNATRDVLEVRVQ